MNFLAWYDGDKKVPTVKKLSEAMDRYLDKFGDHADVIMVNPQTATELRENPMADHLEVREANYIPINTFYVGKKDDGPGENPCIEAGLE